MRNGLRQSVLYGSMLLVAFWAVMSVNGAFMGPARAKAFFNTLPMSVFWCVLLAGLLASPLLYAGIRKRPAMLMLHVGCSLVLAGGLWGSEFSHRHVGNLPMSRGVMLLGQGQASQMMFDEAMTRHEQLPFTVGMVRTWATYYNDNPRGMVKDYYSQLQILETQAPDNRPTMSAQPPAFKIIKEGTIEVNKPLYYGGYHFYQHSFGINEYGPFSGLLITSARGVGLVFAGYGLIFVAMAWYFWWGVLRKAALKQEIAQTPGNCHSREGGNPDGTTQEAAQ